MDAFPVAVLPDLDQPGQMRALSGTLALEGYALGGQRLSTPDGADYDIQLSNTGEAVLLSGTVHARAVTACARCLADAVVEVDGEAQGYYLLEPGGDASGLERDEYDFVGEDGRVDIAPALLAGLVHATPFVVLCREDCAGLCPTCGADLNAGPCACDDGPAPDVDSANPFAALKDFKFDDE